MEHLINLTNFLSMLELYKTISWFTYFRIQIVSVVLENYGSPNKELQDPNQDRLEMSKAEGRTSPSPEILTKVPSWKMIVSDKGETNVTE